MIRAALTLLATVCLGPLLTAADTPLLLTGNGKGQPLRGAAYRSVWAGTNQPKPLGVWGQREWTLFADGQLTDGQPSRLPMNTRITSEILLMKYWVGPDDFELEVDLGQVCEVSKVELEGWQRGFELKCWYAPVRRWLTVARHPPPPTAATGPFRQSLELSPIRVQRLRFSAGTIPERGSSTFSEMYIWGQPPDPETVLASRLPAPLPPADPDQPFTGLALKPSATPPLAADPFVFPLPVTMEISDDELALPATMPLIADASLAVVAADFTASTGQLVPLDLVPAPGPTSGPAIWLGLPNTPGVCAEVAQRLEIGDGSIPPEGYAVEISAAGAVLVGVDPEGLIWATKTFQQLLRRHADGRAAVPLGQVRDYPRARLRPQHGYPGWQGQFRRDLLRAMIATKNNLLITACDDDAAAIAARHRIKRAANMFLFPGSACGVGGTLLERPPGMRANQIRDITRMSADPAHPGFWPGLVAALDRIDALKARGHVIDYIDLGLDEMFDNPWMVSARGRSRGLSEREALLDTVLRAMALVASRGYKPMLLSTSYSVGVMDGKGRDGCSPFAFLLDLPDSDLVCWTYGSERDGSGPRATKNQALRDKGFFLFAQGAQQVTPEVSYDAGLFANWGSEGRAVFMGQFLPRMQMLAEANWSAFERQLAFESAAWRARRNRIVAFSKLVIDELPLPVPGKQYSYHPIDLRSATNRTLRDDVYGDGQGWFDEGPRRDLRHLPGGRQTFASVPFEIADRAVIVAGPGSADNDLPDRVDDLAVGRKVGALHFLHTCRRDHWRDHGKDVSLVGFYQIRYDDDTFISQPLYLYEHLRPWREHFGYREMTDEPIDSPASGATVAWRGGTDGGDDITLYAMAWRNPYPDKVVAGVGLLASAYTETNDNRVALLALTARDADAEDLRIAAHSTKTPPLREYAPRPPLPPDVARLDLTRFTAPPALARADPAAACRFSSDDGWVTAAVPWCAPDKADPNSGVYSALHADDEGWRGQGDLDLRFKRPVNLRAIGVKATMQNMRIPELTPAAFSVWIQAPEATAWEAVGSVSGHFGEEGEARWVLPDWRAVTAVRITVTDGRGIGSVNLYGTPIGQVRRRAISEQSSAGGGILGTGKDLEEAEILDELEGP